MILLEKDKTGAITMTSFDNNAFCTWTIKAPVGVRIKITVSDHWGLLISNISYLSFDSILYPNLHVVRTKYYYV